MKLRGSYAWASALTYALAFALPFGPAGAADLPPPPPPVADQPIAELIAELGLRPAATASRELPGWRPPRLIYVRASEASRIERLRRIAPGVEFVAVQPGDRLAAADASLGFCTAAALAASPRLRWIQQLKHGADDCLSVPGVRERGVALTVIHGMAAAPVADHALALVLSRLRGLDIYAAGQARQQWSGMPPIGADGKRRGVGELRGRTLLVYGLGGIGTEIARRAHAFDMRVLGIRASSRTGPEYVAYVGLPAELHALAAQADYVVNVAPLTDATRRVFDDAFFAALKPGAYFVNVGRGESVDTDALLRALRGGRLGGAALDVVDPEPLPKGHPLWTTPDVVVTPHVAGLSPDTLERRWRIAEENLRRYVAGEPLLGLVDPAKGY